jgi:putative flippase GtrA
LVGITTSILDYLLFIFIYSNLEYILISNFISGVISISFNYLAHYSWSFKSKSVHSESSLRYLMNLIVFWTFGTIILNFLIQSDIDPKVAKLIPIVLIAPFSFLSLKYFVFKNSN